jgi:hypothetical protein
MSNGRSSPFLRQVRPNNAKREIQRLSVSTLVLKHANKNRLGAIDWGPNDFDVLNADRCVGRLFMSPQAPQGHPWFWTITARDYPRSIHTRGYSATREQAMADFKAQWLSC